MGLSRELKDDSNERLARRRSDCGDDLDPRLIHRLEPLGLLLGILVALARGDLIPAPPVSLQRSNSLLLKKAWKEDWHDAALD
jgi:hypothetical protein